MLKVNVPKRCVEFDDKNQPIPASFDASTLEDDDDDDDDDQSDGKPTTSSKIVRLLMRQDSTHRVILNSVLMASTKFQERQTLKATSVLFVAIEGDDPVSFQIKVCRSLSLSLSLSLGHPLSHTSVAHLMLIIMPDERHECPELLGHDDWYPERDAWRLSESSLLSYSRECESSRDLIKLNNSNI